MARLDQRERGELPDRAFAYVDSRGRRRLPIHDESHVRNALARFGQVRFEDDDARDRARTKLLRAAKRYRIVPVGFIAGQLKDARRGPAICLPSGFVTMWMSDVEGSTPLVHRLGQRWGPLLDELRQLQRAAITTAGGCEVEARADELFGAFESPRAAVDAAIAVQQDLDGRRWDGAGPVLVRIGIHSGYPTSTADNYLGTDVHLAARICAAGHGGQVVVSDATREAVRSSAPEGVRFKALGAHRLRGLPTPQPLYQVAAKGLRTRFPALRATPV